MWISYRRDTSIFNYTTGSFHKENGYMRIHVNGKHIPVHRLIALSFVSNPDNLPIVDHINGNRTTMYPKSKELYDILKPLSYRDRYAKWCELCGSVNQITNC